MAAKIYIATKGLIGHSYWVFDPDGNPTSGDETIIRGGLSDEGGSGYYIEVDRAIADSRDALAGDDPYSDRNYTTVFSGTLTEVQEKWDDMKAAANALGSSIPDPDPTYTGKNVVELAEATYFIPAPDCHTLTGTIGAAVGFNVEANLPKWGGDTGSGDRTPLVNYPGIDARFSSTGNDNVTLNPENNVLFDQGGADVYTFDPTDHPTFTGTLNIFEDTDSGTTDKIVLENVDPNDVEFIRTPNGDLLVYLDGRSQPLIRINDQFDDAAPRMNTLWVYPPGGGAHTVLPLNDPSDFPLIGPPQAVGGWVPGVTTPYGTGESQLSPIVLDVDASGTIELAALNGIGSVYWDIDGDDFREASGWMTGGDGVLCVVGANGVVDGQGELFGNDATYANGYLKLDALYDSNNDNAITSADTNFGDLRVWVDANADGYSDAAELFTLSAIGIASIATGYSTVNYSISGNAIKQQSTFTMNGSSYTSVDAWFSYDNVNSEFSGDYTLDIRTLFLPTLRGYGTLADLHIAMSEDATLLGLVQNLTTSYATATLADLPDLQTDFREILLRWAGVDGVSPTSRGLYFDAQDLGFLEAFMDDGFNQYPGNVYNPWPNASVYLREASYNAYNGFFARFLAQVETGDLFIAKPSYDPITDEFTGSFTLNFTHIEELLDGANAGAADIDRIKDVAALLRIVDAAIGFANLSTGDRTDLDALLQASDPLGVFNVDAFDYYFHQDPNVQAAGDATNNIILTGVNPGTTNAGSGNDVVFGSTAQDTINGQDGNDTIIGGTNRDFLSGGNGDDTFIFNLGDSNISAGTETLTESVSQGTDTIRFGAGINPNDIRFWTGANGIAQIYYSATDYIQMYGAYNATTGATEFYNNVERISFADGTVWDLTTGLNLRGTTSAETIKGSALNDTVNGDDGNDVLYGYGGNDTLIGGIRSDTLSGGTGDDIYVFNLGDSNTLYGYSEAVTENTSEGTDTILFGSGIDPDAIRVVTGTSGQLYFYYSTNDYFTVNGSYNATTGESLVYNHVERVEFDDSTVWDLTQGLMLRGTVNGETIKASALADVVNGDDGADILYGYGGTDTLYGGNGNDFLYGGDAADTLSGQAGTDTLYGGAGADIFMFMLASAFSNVDTIADFNTGQADALDVSDLLGLYDPLTHAITDFVQITTSGINSSLFVDRDGTAATYGFNQIATISGVTGLTDEAALVSSGHLIVA